jgi:hypothetical protein
MTTAVLPLYTSRQSLARPDHAVGQEAAALRELLETAVDHHTSVVLGKRHWDLESVRWEAAADNWDGYGGRRISDAAYAWATVFLKALPITNPDPEIAADPDGEVSFSWLRGPGEVFSVSVGQGGRVSYAGLFGTRTVHGTEFFTDELPDPIQANLARLFPAGA